MSSPGSRCFAVIPAAGLSRRMGQPKLLLPWNSATVIEAVLATWQTSRVNSVVLVSRADDGPLHGKCQGVELVKADPAPEEMSDSVRLGLQFILDHHQPGDDDCWMLAPADQPLLTVEAINQVLDAHDATAPQILVPEHQGKRGHPTLFPWSVARQVLTLPASGSVRDVVHQLGYRSIPTDAPSVLCDLDTPEDYRRAQGLPPVSTDEVGE